MKSTVLLIPALALFLIACDRTNNDPGFDYFPDMFYSKAYEDYTDNPNFADGMTMREPVAGTIPVDMVPYPYEKNDTDRMIAGKELVNPLAATPEDSERGKVLFGRYCINCHGAKADGTGNLITSGLYTLKPASLVSDKMKKAPDGEIYHVITVGQGVMMAHGGQIRPEDRWRIVMYVRELQE